MSNIYSSLLFSFAGLIIGFMGGQSILWKRRGSLIVPTYHPRPRQRGDFIVGILIVILATGSLTQGVVAQQIQTDCNNEFRRVLSERSELTNRQSREAVELQRKLIDIGRKYDAESLRDPETRAEQHVVGDEDGQRLARYTAERDQARQQFVDHLADIDRERAANPYPYPRC